MTPMLITKLDQHPVILGKPWMKKHGVILDIKNDQFTFWPGHCQHFTIKPCADEPCIVKSFTAEPWVDMPKKPY